MTRYPRVREVDLQNRGAEKEEDQIQVSIIIKIFEVLSKIGSRFLFLLKGNC